MNDEDYIPEYLPPPIHTTELVLSDAWQEACAKYGYHPTEFLGYSPLVVDRQAIEEMQASDEYEMELRRVEYEMEITRLVAIIAYDPTRVAKVLMPKDTGCKDWCCNDFAA